MMGLMDSYGTEVLVVAIALVAICAALLWAFTDIVLHDTREGSENQ